MDRDELREAREVAKRAMRRAREARGDFRSDEQIHADVQASSRLTFENAAREIDRINRSPETWFPMERSTAELVIYSKADMIDLIKRHSVARTD